MKKSDIKILKDLYSEFLIEILKSNIFNKPIFRLLAFRRVYIIDPKIALDRYSNDKSHGGIIKEIIDHNSIDQIIRGEIVNLEIVKKIFDRLSKCGVPSFMKSNFEEDKMRFPSITLNLIARFICRLIERSDFTINFNQKVFESTFQELVEFLDRDELSYHLFISLNGPLGNVESLPISDFEIKKADYEITKLFAIYYTDVERPEFELMRSDYYIDLKRKVNKNNWFSMIQEENKIKDTIFKTLIFSNIGNVELGKSLRISNDWPLIKTEKININPIIKKYDHKNSFKYFFDINLVNILSEKYKEIKQINFEALDEKTLTSINRLTNTKSSIDFENRVIELVLSIEYLINTSPYEVTLQLCLKIIKLYNTFDKYNEDELFKLLKDFFALRGNIVHGNKIVKADEKDIRLVSSVEEIFQVVLLKFVFLNQTYSYKQINAALDKSLYTNKTIEEILNKNCA
ncbi:MAG: hypothetical protein JW702_09295 [Clostridiales bacterium]|nr:hypothetical protein [Clostridiales bacterium]